MFERFSYSFSRFVWLFLLCLYTLKNSNTRVIIWWNGHEIIDCLINWFTYFYATNKFDKFEGIFNFLLPRKFWVWAILYIITSTKTIILKMITTAVKVQQWFFLLFQSAHASRKKQDNYLLCTNINIYI